MSGRRGQGRTAARALGFTLAEVLVAVAVTSFIGVVVASTLSVGFKAKEVVEVEADLFRELRSGMGRLTREISMAFLSSALVTRTFSSLSPILVSKRSSLLGR